MGKCFLEGVHAGLICTMGGIWEDALLMQLPCTDMGTHISGSARKA